MQIMDRNVNLNGVTQTSKKYRTLSIIRDRPEFLNFLDSCFPRILGLLFFQSSGLRRATNNAYISCGASRYCISWRWLRQACLNSKISFSC